MRKHLKSIFDKSPEEALEYLFDLELKENRNYLFLWSSVIGLDGLTYGKYKNITRKYILGRKYLILWKDSFISLHFIDVVFNPRYNSYIEINKLETEKYYESHITIEPILDELKLTIVKCRS